MTRRSGGILLIWCMALGIAAWFAATGTHLETELSRLFPDGATPIERLLLAELRTGAGGRLVLVALEGQDAGLLAAASKQLAAWMRHSGAFAYVGNGEQAWTKEEQQRLFQNRYVLSPGVQASTFHRLPLRHALEQRLRDLASPLSPVVKELIPADPTGEATTILEAWMTGTAPVRHQGVWFSSNLRRALLVAETQSAGFDLDAQERLQERINEALKSVSAAPPDAAAVHVMMTGPSVIAVETRRTIQDDVWRLSLCATLLVTILLFVSYGSVTVLALSLLPLASAILAGILAVDLAFGSIHGMTLAFGITLLGVVDDYPIHLFSHLTREHRAPAVMKEIWPTMRLGAVATALGFSALLLSGFPGLSQLGLFALVGLFTAASVTRGVLPHVVPQGFHTRRHGRQLALWIDAMTKARLMVPLAVVLAVGAFIFSESPLWEQDLANLTPMPRESKELDQTLRAELGVPDVRDLIVVEGASEEETLQRSETLAAALTLLVEQGELAGYDLAARYLPSRKTQQARLAALPDRDTLERTLNWSLRGLPFKPGLFQPFVDAMDTAKAQVPVDLQTFRGTALGLKLNSLLFMREARWLALVPLHGVTNRQQFRDRLAPWRDQGVSYMDLKEESNRMITRYRDETLRLLGWGGLSIALVLLAGLRAPVTVLRVLLPIGSALVVVAAVLHGLGERFSLFHIASFLLVIGLGLDYALFFNRRHGTPAERGRTVYGLVVCSTTTILVFGLLALSSIPVLRAIGLTTALGSLACLVFAALLAQPPEKPPLSDA